MAARLADVEERVLAVAVLARPVLDGRARLDRTSAARTTSDGRSSQKATWWLRPRSPELSATSPGSWACSVFDISTKNGSDVSSATVHSMKRDPSTSRWNATSSIMRAVARVTWSI